MKDFLSAWPEVAARVEDAGSLLVLTDFDGTLVPLEERPERVTLPEGVKSLLESFASHPRLAAGVISGRRLSDLEDRVGVKGLWYVGNHGFEVRTPSGEKRAFYGPDEANYLRGVEREVAAQTAAIPGVLIENKGPTLAVHYRRVEASRASAVEGICRETFFRHQRRIRLMHGMCVHELRLKDGFNKGTAVRLIRKESPRRHLTFYFGDDVTDDDVFRGLQGVGIGIIVGPRVSRYANYSLKGPDETVEAMTRLRKLLKVTSGHPENDLRDE